MNDTDNLQIGRNWYHYRMRKAILALILLAMSAANGWRAWGFYTQAAVLHDYGIRANPSVLMATALAWCVIFFVLVVCVGVGKLFVRWLVPLVWVGYALWMAARPTPMMPTLLWHLFLAIFYLWQLRKVDRART